MAGLDATRPFLLFRNIVIFIKFFHGSGVTHIANVCSPGTDAINQVTNARRGEEPSEREGLLNPFAKMKFSLFIHDEVSLSLVF